MAMLYAGTSGFSYPSWKPKFYPAKLGPSGFLRHYAARLNCVEINYTFRRLPSAAAVAKWVEATPPGFVFAVKAHMRITHMLRLKDAGEATDLFLSALGPLRASGRLGPVLFQLPPQLKRDTGLLRSYLKSLPKGLQCAVEFRHESWLVEEVYDVLRRRDVSLCVAESEKLETPEVATAGFLYYRLRKPTYSAADLRAIEGRARELLAQGRDLYLIFKHEDKPAGPLNAERVLKMAALQVAESR